jgi:hypothetical protein
LNQSLGKIGIDSPISKFVRIGESGSFQQGSETGVIQLSVMHRQTDLDVAETLSIRELSECHRQKLLPTSELSNAMVSVITFDTSPEFVVRDVFNDLSENGSTAVHRVGLLCVELPRVCRTAKNFKSFKPFFAPYRLNKLDLFDR